MRQAKLTKRLVDSTEYQGGPDTRVWDAELAGFCLRVYPSGRKSYAVKYRVDGRQRWYTIGAHGSPWSPDEARLKARQILNGAAHSVKTPSRRSRSARRRSRSRS